LKWFFSEVVVFFLSRTTVSLFDKILTFSKLRMHAMELNVIYMLPFFANIFL